MESSQTPSSQVRGHLFTYRHTPRQRLIAANRGSGSDAVLIGAGVAGAGALFTAAPWLVTLARWGGALFLLTYAALAARRALHRSDPEAGVLRVDPGPAEEGDRGGVMMTNQGLTPPAVSGGSSRVATSTVTVRTPTASTHAVPEPSKLLAVVTAALALTWLNPHVYLDTFVLLGSVGSSHGSARWAFAAGAICGSMLWFSALGLAARALAPVFARPAAWRVLDGIIAVVMTCVATGLLLGS